MRNTIGYFGLLLLFPVLQVDAATIGAYRTMTQNSPSAAKIYVNGVANGFEWSNSINEQRNVKPLYCPPSALTLNADNYVKILDVEIRRRGRNIDESDPVELALFMGLLRTFPCQ